ncbi:MAG TPA: DoxX family membrane protein [Patescibacteria group bacterium]|nr:DoxX family membrane protein [Patescibacteria group bacterium]
MIAEYAFLLGRIIFGGYFLQAAYNHFSKLTAMSGYAAGRGVPAPKLAVFATGVLLLLGGLGVLLGAYVHWALLCLAVFLAGVTPAMHSFWRDADPGQKMGNTVNFAKNLALLGAVLMMYLLPLPWPFGLR